VQVRLKADTTYEGGRLEISGCRERYERRVSRDSRETEHGGPSPDWGDEVGPQSCCAHDPSGGFPRREVFAKPDVSGLSHVRPGPPKGGHYVRFSPGYLSWLSQTEQRPKERNSTMR